MATLFVDSEIGLSAEQSAGSLLDYGLDWSDVLATIPGDEIVASDWQVDDPALLLTNKSFAGAITSVWTSGGVQDEWYALENSITTRDGRRFTRACLLHILPAISTGSALFKSRLVALAKIRRDRLVMLANSIMPDLQISDDYIWTKLLAAESVIAGMLRVPLQPTKYFPKQPTQEQIDALDGMPWEIDNAYDYDPANYAGDRWGFIPLRKRPVQSIEAVRFVYPSPAATVMNFPLEWVRVDQKYGHVQFVPTSAPFLSPIGGMVMQRMAGGRTLPFAIEFEYVAGIANAAKTYPELVEAVTKLAVLKIVEDGYMPQSGSISADGLSQSISVDVSKYTDAVDRLMNGADGSNGGLVARINGIRLAVL